MQETVETLTRARDDAALEFERAEGEIARARLEGDGEALARLRVARDAALRDADEAGDALALAHEIAAAERVASEGEADAARELRVRELRAERLEAARAVDDALAALEAAVAGYTAVGRELGAVTRTSSAISRKESQNMRWAIWASAERTAALLRVPFANGRRRARLSELEGADG